MYSPRKHQERFLGCGVDADMLTFNYLRNTIGVYWYEEEVEAKETTQNLKLIVFKLQSLWECEFILVFPLQHFPLHTPLTALPQEMMFYEARDFNIYSKRILSNRSKFEPLNPNYHTHMGIKNKILTLEKKDSNLQLTATFSWHFISNFLVAVLSEVLPGILPDQSYCNLLQWL